MSARTPGPWTVNQNAYGAVFVHGGETLTTAAGTEYKALVVGGNSHDTLTIENAYLIAAAPEMLEALDLVVGCLLWNKQDDISIEVMRRVNAVRAKAEGRS